ncbi:MAG: cyanophycin synthetase, partial [Phycisphaeraceae bacterium]|nr:cyanophycin synthetase [Phycisphaeraceae bacterium]
QPAVSGITPVGLDHTAVLGETIAAIASEKAGIIKPSTPVIVGRQSPEAADVIKIKAKECAAPLIDALESVKQRYAAAPNGPGSGQDVMLEGAFGAYRFNLPLAGKHQVDNACVAVAAIESFDEREAVSSTEATCRGLAATRWPGRIQVLDAGLNGTPALLVDGAHTAESAAALVNTVNEMFPRRRKTILIYGGSGGHDFSATAAVLNRLDPHVVVTRSRHPKSVDSQSVASALVSDNVNVASRMDTTRTALAEARRLAGSQDLIIGAGSLAIAAEIIEIENGMEPEYYPTLNVGAR